MRYQPAAAIFLIFCFFLSTGCQETAVPPATAVSQAVPSEQPATPTAVPPTVTSPPSPTGSPPTTTSTNTATPAPTATPAIWQEVARMPSSRSEMSAGVIDGRIYVPGGWTNGFGQSTALEMYDPATDTWTRLADLPFHVNHHATAVYQNALYVFGPEDTALRYDPASDTWQELAPMPERRYAAAAAVLGDFVYVIGGSGSTSDLLRYDPASNSWTRLAPLLQAREHTQAVALDDQLYALGGRWDRGLNSVERYDPANDTWFRAPAMNQPRSGFGAAVWDGKIVVAGGELLSPLDILDTIEIFDPAQNRWEMLAVKMPVPLHGLPIAVIGDELYLLGGSGLAGDVANRGRVYLCYLA
ncbi:MAG: hypothetical protein IPM53_13235 [Anaerolineaceae bacterium]|nr:hypothetical protein [Anaerolineaceae bacterium]